MIAMARPGTVGLTRLSPVSALARVFHHTL
jgi:hypothetical protein